jgi:hypothetical protein
VGTGAGEATGARMALGGKEGADVAWGRKEWCEDTTQEVTG